ncbi:hypothetical protein L1049_007702 [Liquidambar formosana]|uniref:Uncharacterized protein n=1 Tax=Liquidambar formosana TaxID=63359 RepID=A0AAP0S8Q2_LIQFO
MAEFPPNIDDGERRLPSDIFPDEVIPSRYSPHFPCIDDLAQQFAGYTLLQPSQTTPKKPPPNVEPFKPPVGYDAVDSPPSRHFSVNGGPGVGQTLYSYETGGFCAGLRPFYRYFILQPAHPQVENFLQMRARVLQRQQNSSQNRVLPVERSGFGRGGFVRDSSEGTGVFLPRVAATTTTTTTNSAITDVRKKQGVRNRHEAQVTQQIHTFDEVAMAQQQEECHCQLSPETGLPQDWTY